MRKTVYVAGGLAMLLLLLFVIRMGALHGSWQRTGESEVAGEQVVSERNLLETKLEWLRSQMTSRIPRSYYLVINTTRNEFYLYQGTRLVRKDLCSTGSYLLLKNGEQQQWIFRTPKGEFRVKGKQTQPVWKKPDWAFVEAGLKPPPPGHPSRYEAGVLGAYALDLGEGYLIHGTLYQRFLGLPVTHGCIRLGDMNLELVYRHMPLGGRVYIF